MLHANPAIADVLQQLSAPSLPIISMGLERVHALLDRLGNPQHVLPPVVHIAGTNGKGSVLAYMRAGLEAAGLRVHCYTSPHLVRFNERIRVAGAEIDDTSLELLLRRVQAAAEHVPTTFFEATTAAAFLAFAETPADIVLLETGMGGRLDATNVVDTPLLTVITPISMDHTEYLGDTLAAIAYEKAGIMKPAVPCVVAPQPEAVRAVIVQRAAEIGATIIHAPKPQSVSVDGAWQYAAEGAEALHLPAPVLQGAYQYDNAALAICALQCLSARFGLGQAHYEAAMQYAFWPARLQQLPATHALVHALPKGSAAWLDGGHNAAAGKVVGEWLQQQSLQDTRSVWLIWGMLASKDAAAYLRPIATHCAGVVAIAVDAGEGMLAHTPQHLAEVAEGLGVATVRTATDWQAAAAMVEQACAQPVRILVAGSLYLAGDVLAAMPA